VIYNILSKIYELKHLSSNIEKSKEILKVVVSEIGLGFLR